MVVSVRGKPELIHFAVGFSKNVDPLTGMTVNLKEILGWLEEWKELSSRGDYPSWMDFLSQAQGFFAQQALKEKAQAAVVQAKFFDQSTLRWNGDHFSIAKQAPIVDRMARLRMCVIHFRLPTESDLERLRKFTLPSEIPGSFDEPEFFLTYFESVLGLPIDKAEIQDPQTKVSVILP